MAFISVFEVVGPNMVGPSSSHTAGAAAIGYLAQKLAPSPIKKVKFTLYNSFALTGSGHGTDRALLGGILGYATDDERIVNSYAFAKEANIEYEFIKNDVEDISIFENSVDIEMECVGGEVLTVRGESIGGGKMRLSRINGIEVDIDNEMDGLLFLNACGSRGLSTAVSYLEDSDISISSMRFFRDSNGEIAYIYAQSNSEIKENSVSHHSRSTAGFDVILIKA